MTKLYFRIIVDKKLCKILKLLFNIILPCLIKYCLDSYDGTIVDVITALNYLYTIILISRVFILTCAYCFEEDI